MKTKYFPQDKVKTPTATGVVKESATFTDHVEHLVQFADGTASWIHEDKLSPAPIKKPLTTK
jgi:hypothetical protein